MDYGKKKLNQREDHMKALELTEYSADYQKVEQAIQFIGENFKSQPSLDQIAASVHLSRFHFDRLFKRWAGISPMRFVKYLTLDYTKQCLSESRSLLDSSLDAGMSGPGRLHDLFVSFEAMTPGEFKRQGSGLEITYGIGPSPFGRCLLATTLRGICYLGFLKAGGSSDTLDQMFNTWSEAKFTENPERITPILKGIFRIDSGPHSRPFNLQIKGTNFQINVWRALLQIPPGCVVNYQDIAAYIGHPKAFRATGNAIAINPVAYLIPCHRVIAKSGKFHRYRWGSARKKAIVGWEAARRAQHQ
jgi:AraC family transcriptional regulator of adaptative response/methylated-DNA-[protein]-cysteine methyltransferase